MAWDIAQGVMLPFLGTALGAACVFFLHGRPGSGLQRAMTGFAAGVMTAASVWSLLIPAMEQSASLGRWSFLPAVGGFWAGVLFLLALDRFIPHSDVIISDLKHFSIHSHHTFMLILAVVLHNLPEGMAVGAAFAGALAGRGGGSMTGAFVLALGIAIQNLPEGAIISLPLRAEGTGKPRAFLFGALSGVVEPLGALLVLLSAGAMVPALPWFLSFAAGAMLHVVVKELVPEMRGASRTDAGALLFSAGFTVMLALDAAFS